MNKWLIILAAVIVVPFIAACMWIRHPRVCWREMKNSWNLVMRGKSEDDQ